MQETYDFAHKKVIFKKNLDFDYQISAHSRNSFEIHKPESGYDDGYACQDICLTLQKLRCLIYCFYRGYSSRRAVRALGIAYPTIHLTILHWNPCFPIIQATSDALWDSKFDLSINCLLIFKIHLRQHILTYSFTADGQVTERIPVEVHEIGLLG